MAIQLGSAYGKIALNVADFMKGIKQGKDGLFTLASAGEELGGALKNVGSKLTIGLTLPIAALGAASIKAASDFEETRNKALVVFDEMGDSVVQNANRAAATLGVSKTQYLDYASSIGAALKAGGASVKESADLAEQAVKHFADLASFHNAQVEEVAAAWQSAIRGQYEPIQKYFPFITDSYLKTYGVANGLVDENTTKLTANQRAIILNAIALDEKLNPAVNDFAETSDGLANSTRIMKAEWQDALILFGQNLLPIALQVVHALNRMLESFNNLSPVQQKMVLGFAGFLAILGPLLSGIGTLISTVSTISGGLGVLSTMGVSLTGIGTSIMGFVVPAVAAVGAALLPISVILASLILMAGLFAIAWKTNFLGIRDNITNSIKFWTNLFKAFFAFLRGDTKSATEYMTEAFTTLGEQVNKIFSKVFGIQDAWGKFLEFMRNALSKVVSYISDVFTKIDWSRVGRYVTIGLANGMLMGIPAMVDVAIRAAMAALDAIKKTLGISSPSKAFAELGKYSAQGYQMGLAGAMNPNAIANAMAKPVNQLASSQQQNLTMNFANGLTIQQVRAMIDANNEQMMDTIIGALGGAS